MKTLWRLVVNVCNLIFVVLMLGALTMCASAIAVVV